MGDIFSAADEIGPEAHLAYCTTGTGLFAGGKIAGACS